MSAEIIAEYGKNPSNWGRLQNPDFSHTEKNISCGEEIVVDLKFDKDEKIAEIGFEAEGRLITIAAMSLLSEEMENKKLDEIETFAPADILDLLEVENLSPRRKKSAMLGLLTLKNAFRAKNQKPLLDFGDLMENEF